ncbi:MAG: TolB family protein [Bacteroidota bacterium]
MTNKILLVALVFSLGFLISCGDNSTGTDPDPDESEETEKPAVTTGTIEVTITTEGESLDEDGYELAVDGDTKPADIDDTITFSELEEGTYDVEMNGVAENCSIDGDNPIEITITAEETTSAEMKVNCKYALKDKIVFASDREDQTDLYSMNPDGNNVKRLTETSGEERYPAISPDGTQVVFWQQNPSAGSNYGTIRIINADGSSPKKLTEQEYGATHPVWSPDGKEIAFSQGKKIRVMNADGTERKAITDDTNYDFAPSWSPDGESFVFSSDGENSSRDIYVLDIGESGRTNLTDNDFYNNYPAWSPDGNKIAFLSNESDPDDIYTALDLYIMDVDGNNREKIADLAIAAVRSGDKASTPSWSPDGSKIVIADRNGSSHEIYVIDTDGSENRETITLDTGVDNVYPYWSLLE